jgi:hypothetical protein
MYLGHSFQATALCTFHYHTQLLSVKSEEKYEKKFSALIAIIDLLGLLSLFSGCRTTFNDTRDQTIAAAFTGQA